MLGAVQGVVCPLGRRGCPDEGGGREKHQTGGEERNAHLAGGHFVHYRVEAAAAKQPSPNPSAPYSAARSSSGANRLFGYLANQSLSAGLILLALGFAALLGALHALTPGHAKTLMAAYLVGSGGTIRHALTLGAVVTFTHTASVIVIGLIALLAGRFLLPGVLVPALQVLAGLLILVLGLRLMRQRWPLAARTRRGARS